MMMLRRDDHPTVQIPPLDFRHVEDPTAHTVSYEDLLAALHRFLPGNRDDEDPDDFDFQADAFSGDDFRMFEFKVKKCAVVRSHDWTACPFAHPGEKARRRDPRRYHYSGSACPDFRKGGACGRGDACEYAHGVFESWLHPARYRTQPCKEGTGCRRRVCFFAHTPEQLRVLPYVAESSPSRLGNESFVSTTNLLNFSPKSTLYHSPSVSPSVNSVDQLGEFVRLLQLRGTSSSPRPQARVGSPLSPTVPLSFHGRPQRSSFDAWGISSEDETLMERVESGRELREKIYAKLGKENSLVSGSGWG